MWRRQILLSAAEFLSAHVSSPGHKNFLCLSSFLICSLSQPENDLDNLVFVPLYKSNVTNTSGDMSHWVHNKKVW